MVSGFLGTTRGSQGLLDCGRGGRVAQDSFAFLDILTQVQAYDAESDLFVAATDSCNAGCAELLMNLKLNGALAQAIVAIDGDAHGEDLCVAVLDPMVYDGTFVGTAAMLAMDAPWQMPLDHRHARHEWHIVEICNFEVDFEFGL